MIKKEYTDAINALHFDENFDTETIDAMRQAVNQQNKKKVPDKRKSFAAAAIAAAIVLCLCLTAAVSGLFTKKAVQPGSDTVPVTQASPFSLVLSLNPEIAFHFGANGTLLDVTGLNDDGISLLEGVPIDGLTFHNAAVVIVNRLIQNNYISFSHAEDALSLTLTGAETEAGSAILKEMQEVIRCAAENNGVSITVSQESNDTLQLILNGSTDSLTPAKAAQFVFNPAASAPDTCDYITCDYDGAETEAFPIDLSGAPLSYAAFRTVLDGIYRGAIVSGKTEELSLLFPDCSGTAISDAQDLVGRLLESSGFGFTAAPCEEGLTLSLTGGTAENAAYSLGELLDSRLFKAPSLITEEQKDLLQDAFIRCGGFREEELSDLMAFRCCVVIPDFTGMDEETAVSLCRSIGLLPVTVHDPAPAGNAVNTVFYQDMSAGALLEYGCAFHLGIARENGEDSASYDEAYSSDALSPFNPLLTDEAARSAWERALYKTYIALSDGAALTLPAMPDLSGQSSLPYYSYSMERTEYTVNTTVVNGTADTAAPEALSTDPMLFATTDIRDILKEDPDLSRLCREIDITDPVIFQNSSGSVWGGKYTSYTVCQRGASDKETSLMLARSSIQITVTEANCGFSAIVTLTRITLDSPVESPIIPYEEAVNLFCGDTGLKPEDILDRGFVWLPAAGDCGTRQGTLIPCWILITPAGINHPAAHNGLDMSIYEDRDVLVLPAISYNRDPTSYWVQQ